MGENLEAVSLDRKLKARCTDNAALNCGRSTQKRAIARHAVELEGGEL
jgi:hypothetical protein